MEIFTELYEELKLNENSIERMENAIRELGFIKKRIEERNKRINKILDDEAPEILCKYCYYMPCICCGDESWNDYHN